MRARRLFYFSITGCFTLLVIFLLGEAGTRLFTQENRLPDPPPPSTFNPYRENSYIARMQPYIYFYIPGSRYTQKLAPYTNDYRINSMGFRGKDIPVSPSPGMQRLAVIGDSIVEGHGVREKETFSSLLDNKLAGSGWEIINLGMQGASPLYYAANLERYLYLQPDAVLLVIHENDLYEDEVREQQYFTLPVLENRETLYSGGTVQPWLQKSRLVSFLLSSGRKFLQTELEHLVYNHSKTPAVFSPSGDRKKKYSFAIPPENFNKRWNMSRDYLDFFHSRLAAHNVELLVTSLCTVTLAFPEVKEYTSHCLSLDNGVRAWTDENNIPYIPLVPEMQKGLDSFTRNDMLLFQDLHPTPAAHEIFSEALYPFIAARLNLRKKTSQEQ